MRTSRIWIALFLTVILLNSLGCSSGPSDADAIQAIQETGLFKGGVESFSLQSPIVIVDKDRAKNGCWLVKVRFTAAYTMAGGKTTKPMERTSVFHICKSKDGTGKKVWKARL